MEAQDQLDQQGPSIQTTDKEVPRHVCVAKPDGGDSAIRGSGEVVPKGAHILLFSSIVKSNPGVSLC